MEKVDREIVRFHKQTVAYAIRNGLLDTVMEQRKWFIELTEWSIAVEDVKIMRILMDNLNELSLVSLIPSGQEELWKELYQRLSQAVQAVHPLEQNRMLFDKTRLAYWVTQFLLETPNSTVREISEKLGRHVQVIEQEVRRMDREGLLTAGMREKMIGWSLNRLSVTLLNNN